MHDVQLEGYSRRQASRDKQGLRAIIYGEVFICVRVCRRTEEKINKGDKNTTRCSASFNYGCTNPLETHSLGIQASDMRRHSDMSWTRLDHCTCLGVQRVSINTCIGIGTSCKMIESRSTSPLVGLGLTKGASQTPAAEFHKSPIGGEALAVPARLEIEWQSDTFFFCVFCLTSPFQDYTHRPCRSQESRAQGSCRNCEATCGSNMM